MLLRYIAAFTSCTTSGFVSPSAAFRASTGRGLYGPAHPAGLPPDQLPARQAGAHAYSFFQSPPRGGHRCRSDNLFPAWVWETFIPSERALPGAPKKKGQPVSGLPFPVLRV